jgi:hypothetical protein
MSSLLPSALREVWDDPLPPSFARPPPGPAPHQHQRQAIPTAGSAPTHGRNFDQNVTFQGEIEFTESAAASHQLYKVQFNPNRSAMFHAAARLRFNCGDFVLTEADRGFDIGQVIEVVGRPSPRAATGAKQIVRAAAHNEVQQLAQKEEREARALQICRAKAAEFGMPMNITRAEFQFDGKKLSFYYTAESYVDFRDLVRALFKVFGTRIWMVWYGGDQGGPEG